MSTIVGQEEKLQEVQQLILRCCEGKEDAWKEFQERYGEIIYGYPIRVYRSIEEAAADFYVYVFEEGRIFRRLRSYQGKAPFTAFLRGFVLDAMFIDWHRTLHEAPTVAVDDVDVTPNHALDEATGTQGEVGFLADVLVGIETSKAVVMKLLYVEDAEFTPEEILHIAKASGKPVKRVLADIDTLRESVRSKEADHKEIEGKLDAVHSWIQLYQKQLLGLERNVDDTIHRFAREERDRNVIELNGKLSRRQEQRQRLLAQLRTHKTTAAYKDIAEILNTTVGNIGSQIARVRKQLERTLPRMVGP